MSKRRPNHIHRLALGAAVAMAGLAVLSSMGYAVQIAREPLADPTLLERVAFIAGVGSWLFAAQAVVAVAVGKSMARLLGEDPAPPAQ